MHAARSVGAALLAAIGTGAHADDGSRYVGDLGIAIERTQASAAGARARNRVLPYAYGDWGRLFVREDTFGAKLLPLGWGALEVVGRISTEGDDADRPGHGHRANPRPVGLGTFQETPWGGVFADAFVDTVSGGTLLEASYAAELPVGPVALYPQAGFTRRSARYDAHLHDVHAAATTPVLQLSAEWPFASHWALLAHAQWEAPSRAAGDGARASALVAVAWRFK